MSYAQGTEKSGKAYVSFEVEDIARKLAIAVLSFLSSAAVALLLRHLLRNNGALLLFLLAAVFTALFATSFAKAHIKGYVEKYGWLVIPPALAAVFAVSSVKPLVFVVLFIIHTLTCFFLRTLKNTARLGIELIMLITVLGSFVYGAKIGAVLGATAMLMDYALSARFSYFVPVTTAAYVLTGLVAGSFSTLGITTVGIAATIIYNLATSFIIVAFMGGHIDKCLRFGLSNIALNFVIFTTIAPWLLSILK